MRVRRQVNLLDPPDGDVVDFDAGLRHQVEHIGELCGDPVRMVAEVGAAGQRRVVEPRETAFTTSREQHDPGQGTNDTSHFWPPPASCVSTPTSGSGKGGSSPCCSEATVCGMDGSLSVPSSTGASRLQISPRVLGTCFGVPALIR